MAITEADTSIRSLELAGFASWPAAKLVTDGSWQIRLSPHLPYKRTNSINCLDAADKARIKPRLARAMAVFAESGVQPTLRATPLTPPELIQACSTDGWSDPYSESVVMTAPLQSVFNHGDFEVFDDPAPQWIADYMALTMDRTIDATAITKALSAIEKPVRFFRVASTAWLQVEAGNLPARRLYDALGFGERYRYAYHSFNTASDQLGQIE